MVYLIIISLIILIITRFISSSWVYWGWAKYLITILTGTIIVIIIHSQINEQSTREKIEKAKYYISVKNYSEATNTLLYIRPDNDDLFKEALSIVHQADSLKKLAEKKEKEKFREELNNKLSQRKEKGLFTYKGSIDKMKIVKKEGSLYNEFYVTGEIPNNKIDRIQVAWLFTNQTIDGKTIVVYWNNKCYNYLIDGSNIIYKWTKRNVLTELRYKEQDL